MPEVMEGEVNADGAVSGISSDTEDAIPAIAGYGIMEIRI